MLELYFELGDGLLRFGELGIAGLELAEEVLLLLPHLFLQLVARLPVRLQQRPHPPFDLSHLSPRGLHPLSCGPNFLHDCRYLFLLIDVGIRSECRLDVRGNRGEIALKRREEGA